MTPREKLDREIALYTALVDARRARCADTIDHEAHLQLLYVQRAAMLGQESRMDELDDVAALLGAQPPVPDAEAELTGELEHYAHPAWWAVREPRADELHVLGAAIAKRWRRRRLRSWFRVLLDAWRAPMSEDPQRTLSRGGFGHFLP